MSHETAVVVGGVPVGVKAAVTVSNIGYSLVDVVD